MDCENCIFQDDITNACVNEGEECVDGSAFVKALDPEDMFKVLFMLIWKLTGNIDFSREDLEKVTDEMKVRPGWDAKAKRYILETDPQPTEAVLVKVPKKIRKRSIVTPRKKLFLPPGIERRN